MSRFYGNKLFTGTWKSNFGFSSGIIMILPNDYDFRAGTITIYKKFLCFKYGSIDFTISNKVADRIFAISTDGKTELFLSINVITAVETMGTYRIVTETSSAEGTFVLCNDYIVLS